MYMNELARIILTILIGMVSGIIGGSTALGGALIIIPAFDFFNIIPSYSKIVGTTLFALLFPLSILAVLEYAKYDEIDYKLALILAISYIIFSYIGSAINVYFKKHNKLHMLKYFSAFMLIISGLYFAYDAYND
jgi:uncharacterized membrane protein YfcA